MTGSALLVCDTSTSTWQRAYNLFVLVQQRDVPEY